MNAFTKTNICRKKKASSWKNFFRISWLKCLRCDVDCMRWTCIRHYGILSSTSKLSAIAQIRAQLPAVYLPEKTVSAIAYDPLTCPCFTQKQSLLGSLKRWLLLKFGCADHQHACPVFYGRITTKKLKNKKICNSRIGFAMAYFE